MGGLQPAPAPYEPPLRRNLSHAETLFLRNAYRRPVAAVLAVAAFGGVGAAGRMGESALSGSRGVDGVLSRMDRRVATSRYDACDQLHLFQPLGDIARGSGRTRRADYRRCRRRSLFDPYRRMDG